METDLSQSVTGGAAPTEMVRGQSHVQWVTDMQGQFGQLSQAPGVSRRDVAEVWLKG